MVDNRNSQKQVWVDKDFIKWLKKVKAMKQIKGEDVNNLGTITSQILKTNAIKDMERQLTSDNLNLELRFKLDKRSGL